MIRGIVNARREAIVRLRVRGPGGVVKNFDTVVDTGFTSSLTLPVKTVNALGLTRHSGSSALLADGSTRQFDIFTVEVEWGNAWRTVFVSAIGNEPLMGMWMLSGHKFMADVIPGGTVEIIPLS